MRRAFMAVFFVLASLVFGQAPIQTTHPGPEHKRLGYFAGDWTIEGDLKENPLRIRGKFSGVEHNEWMRGGLFLISHIDQKGPSGEAAQLTVMGYDSEEKTYTYVAFSSTGAAEFAKGSFSNGTWTWTSVNKIAGDPTKSRFTVSQRSSTTFTFKYEMAPEGGDWSTVIEGKAVKR